jgi:putative SOS response-associated peptidase YedK
MCGFIYNVNDFPLLEPLLDIAGYDESEIRDIIKNQYLRPTDTVINLVPSRNGPRLLGATWWFATLPNGDINTKYSTFNSKAGKLANSSMHNQTPKSMRSIIPATGFCEWQPIFKGGLLYTQLPGIQPGSKLPTPERKKMFLIEQSDQPIMYLASVSKLRLASDGKPKVNTSVITLPPHTDFLDIHHKSFPLVLNKDEVAHWLDPKTPLVEFNHLLGMNDFRQTFTAKEVNNQCEPTTDETIELTPR